MKLTIYKGSGTEFLKNWNKLEIIYNAYKMKPLQEIAEELNDVKDPVKDPVKEDTRKVEPTITGKKRKRED